MKNEKEVRSMAARAEIASLREELAAAERGRPDYYLVSVYQTLRGSRESSQELFDDDEPHYERVLGLAKTVVADLASARAELVRVRTCLEGLRLQLANIRRALTASPAPVSREEKGEPPTSFLVGAPVSPVVFPDVVEMLNAELSKPASGDESEET